MYAPLDQANGEIVAHRAVWLEKQGLSLDTTTRLNISYDTDDYCRYRSVSEVNMGEGMRDGETPKADALITTTKGHALFLPVADCVATALFDPEHTVLMLSHLGRHSLEQQGGVKSVEYLVTQYGSRPEALQVWLGPAPNKEVYPIFKLHNQGLKEAALEQLHQAGVQQEHINDNNADTATDNCYFSYSEFLKGNTPTEGRFAMVAVLQ